MTTDVQRQEWLPTRQSLLGRLRNLEDHDSWREFFDMYSRLLYGVARKAGLDHEDADDVVQTTVLEVADKFRSGAFSYREGGSFKGWLLTLARWRVRDQLRKRRERQFAPVEDKTRVLENLADDSAVEKMSDCWDAEWEKNILQTAREAVKKRVSVKNFQIYDLLVVKEWPKDQVMKTLGVGPAHMYVAKHRVTQQVKKELEHMRSLYR